VRFALFAAGLAQAAETVEWLHVEVNPGQVAIWNEAARAFEASHPGVKVEPPQCVTATPPS
jgi:raffinose/stachyose/melibiose transport system substrate-binding protein